MSEEFPFDDPAWDSARDAYGVTKVRPHLAALRETWDQETANGILFSHLLHQDTIYPATFLALPHVIRLADDAQGKALGTIASFLGGVALSAQLPATSGGVSLVEGEPFRATPLGQRANEVFNAYRPEIARLSLLSFREEQSPYFASGLAAALGHTNLASWLIQSDNGGVYCQSCGEEFFWAVFDARLAIYYEEPSLDDWKTGRPDHAASIARNTPDTPDVVTLRERLTPTDPTTYAMLTTYQAELTCPHCGRQDRY